MKENKSLGHLLAVVTIIIWGTTFISTKVLLTGCEPLEILFLRFVLGIGALFLAKPRIFKFQGVKEELYYALAGLSGITLYYLFENFALTMTFASNVGVITSVAPFFTALGTMLVWREEKAGWPFYTGFVIAMAGIYILSFKSNALVINPKGDLLALLAPMAWGAYSVFVRRAQGYGKDNILVTRRVFEYGTLFMIPAMFIFGVQFDLGKFRSPVLLGNILFLGLCASAMCFATWNYAVKVLGTIKSSIYIYLIPVVTLVTSVIILHEPVNAITILGVALTMSGLFVSEFVGSKIKS